MNVCAWSSNYHTSTSLDSHNEHLYNIDGIRLCIKNFFSALSFGTHLKPPVWQWHASSYGTYIMRKKKNNLSANVSKSNKTIIYPWKAPESARKLGHLDRSECSSDRYMLQAKSWMLKNCNRVFNFPFCPWVALPGKSHVLQKTPSREFCTTIFFLFFFSYYFFFFKHTHV